LAEVVVVGVRATLASPVRAAVGARSGEGPDGGGVVMVGGDIWGDRSVVGGRSGGRGGRRRSGSRSPYATGGGRGGAATSIGGGLHAAAGREGRGNRRVGVSSAGKELGWRRKGGGAPATGGDLVWLGSSSGRERRGSTCTVGFGLGLVGSVHVLTSPLV
jgi:hypothetical protein